MCAGKPKVDINGSLNVNCPFPLASDVGHSCDSPFLLTSDVGLHTHSIQGYRLNHCLPDTNEVSFLDKPSFPLSSCRVRQSVSPAQFAGVAVAAALREAEGFFEALSLAALERVVLAYSGQSVQVLGVMI